MAQTKKPSKRSWSKIIVLLVVVVVIIVGGSVIIARRVYENDLKPVASSQKSDTVVIPEGATLKDIATQLKKQGIIRSDWAFSQYVRNQQASDIIKAGTYSLSPSYSVSEIVSIITEGKVKTNLFTILPGQRLDQVRAALINSGFSATSVDSALNPANYTDHPALVDKPLGANLEGYLYPDSYQKTASTTPEDIIRLSLNEMEKHLTPDVRTAMANQGLSVYQGITLASMAEQEANTPSDRAQVVQVFLTRLHTGMSLESDVTAFYGAHLAGQPASVNYDSAYNTYLHTGLPIGPISNVSDSSLQAVAHPAGTNYLYFIAGDDGTVHFSNTLAEHQAQIQQFCQIKCAQ